MTALASRFPCLRVRSVQNRIVGIFRDRPVLEIRKPVIGRIAIQMATLHTFGPRSDECCHD
jgi:hypothetical protein